MSVLIRPGDEGKGSESFLIKGLSFSSFPAISDLGDLRNYVIRRNVYSIREEDALFLAMPSQINRFQSLSREWILSNKELPQSLYALCSLFPSLTLFFNCVWYQPEKRRAYSSSLTATNHFKCTWIPFQGNNFFPLVDLPNSDVVLGFISYSSRKISPPEKEPLDRLLRKISRLLK